MPVREDDDGEIVVRFYIVRQPLRGAHHGRDENAATKKSRQNLRPAPTGRAEEQNAAAAAALAAKRRQSHLFRSMQKERKLLEREGPTCRI